MVFVCLVTALTGCPRHVKTPPSPVNGLSATADGTGVDLKWTPPTASDLKVIVIRRGDGTTPPNSPKAGTAAASLSPAATTYSDEGLDRNTAYSYAVFTIDKDGLASSPATSTVTTSAFNSPPLPQAQTTTAYADLQFLLDGQPPLQTDVLAGTIQPAHAAGIRGQVLDQNGKELPGATISVADHPEYGHTTSQADGTYVLVVNGGATLHITISTSDRLSVQRTVTPRWQDWVVVDDVTLLPYDPNVSTIDFGVDTPAQTARGSTVHDNDGSRQNTLLFRPGTNAGLVMPDGTTRSASSLHVRITEITVGPTGPSAMPGELPPGSAYTYAVDYSADEALASGAITVRLDRPAIGYVQNFLHLPVGVAVPSGTYNSTTPGWVPDPNGVVIKIVSITGGSADVDTDGDGTADNIGIDDFERVKLASLYGAGVTLWRVPVSQLSDPDWNWPYGLPDGAIAPPPMPPSPPTTDGECHAFGSDIGCESQSLGEHLPIPGSPITLDYRTDHQHGYRDAFTIDIPYGPTDPSVKIPADLVAEVDIEVAGQAFRIGTPGGPFNPSGLPVFRDAQYRFVWDGRDAFGRLMQGKQHARFRVGYYYRAVLHGQTSASTSGAPVFGGPPTSPSYLVDMAPTRQQIIVWSPWSDRTIGTMDDSLLGLGGWTLSGTEPYDVGLQAQPRDGYGLVGGHSSASIGLVAGTPTGDYGDSPDGPTTHVPLMTVTAMTTASDGTTYFAEVGNGNDPACRIRTVTPAGKLSTLTGAAGPGFQDGPRSVAKCRLVSSMAIVPDGSLIIADRDNYRIRQVTMDGAMTTIAGTGVPAGPAIPGKRALDASLYPDSLVVASDGTVYFNDLSHLQIYRLGTDANLYSVIPQQAHAPGRLALAPDGGLYFTLLNSLESVDPTGALHTVIPSSVLPHDSGDGGQAGQATTDDIRSVAVGPDGSIYLADVSNFIRVILPDGIITTIAGGGNNFYDGEPARQADIQFPGNISVLPDGSIRFTESALGHFRIDAVTPALPGVSLDQFTVGSADGTRLTAYDFAGRQQKTYNALTGATLAAYQYDAAGHITSITTVQGTLTVQRDASGNPLSITAPGGHVLNLALDPDGRLAAVRDSRTERVIVLSTNSQGLLGSMTEPAGPHQFTYDDATGRLTKDIDPDRRTVTLSLSRTPIIRTVNVSINGAKPTEHTTSLNTDGSQTTTITQPGQHPRIVTETGTMVIVTTPAGVKTVESFVPDLRFGMQSAVLASATATEPNGRVTTLRQSRTVTLSTPANPLSVQTIRETTTSNGRTTTATYTAADHTLTLDTPGGGHSTTTLDDLGRPVSIQEDANLVPDTIHYDAHGNEDSTIIHGITTAYRYDSDGRLISAADAKGHATTFQYDDIKRTVTTTTPSGRHYITSYDKANNPNSLTSPNAAASTSSYSTFGDLESYAQAGQAATTITRDARGAPATISTPAGIALNTTYNDAEQPLTTTAPGLSASTTYNDIGQPTTTSATTDGTTSTATYTWDGLDLTRLDDTIGSTSYATTNTYDGNGDLASFAIKGLTDTTINRDNDGLPTSLGPTTISRNGPAGAATAFNTGARNETRSYDKYGRLTARSVTVGPFTHTTSYDYDPTTGRISGEHTTINGTTTTNQYEYNLDGWLTKVIPSIGMPTTYTYDNNGNRLSDATTTATYDNGDHTATIQGKPCTSDANGYLTKCNGNTYTYDVTGRLATATTRTGKTTYTYDARGRLAATSTEAGTSHYLYANPAVPNQLTATQDRTGTTTYDYDDDGRLISFTTTPNAAPNDSTSTYVITDATGTPIDLVSHDGTTIHGIDRDPYGRPTGAIPDQTIGFDGGITDPTAGLVHLGARNYDPATGRWLQPDPLFLAGGDPNLYAFARNDPLNHLDPNGLLFDGWQDWDLRLYANLFAGFGDALTFGLTRFINHLTGADQFVDKCSSAYLFGQIAGEVVRAIITEGEAEVPSQGKLNQINGDAWERKLEQAYKDAGFDVVRGPGAVDTEFGIRKPDLAIYDKNGNLLELIEAKASPTAAYSARQQAKDAWIQKNWGVITSVVRRTLDGSVL